MAEDEMILDLSNKKKKKKTKTEVAVEKNNESDDKMTPNLESNTIKEDKLEKITDNLENLELESNIIDLDAKKKKKKKKSEVLDIQDGNLDLEPSGESQATSNQLLYTYEDLLNRVYEIMKDKNPALIDGVSKKFATKPPNIARIGTKKTAFTNFAEISKILKRQPSHLLVFILTELGTTGSVDGNDQLIIKGRFQQKQLETVLKKYVREYVLCHTCRSSNTELIKETRLFFLQCNTCSSRCSVASIKAGFQALTGKRAAQKAKQQ